MGRCHEPSRQRLKGRRRRSQRRAWMVALVLPCSSERATAHPINEARVVGVPNRVAPSDEAMRGKSLDERAQMHANELCDCIQSTMRGGSPGTSEQKAARACACSVSVAGGWPAVAVALGLGPPRACLEGLPLDCLGRCGTVYCVYFELCTVDKVKPCDSSRSRSIYDRRGLPSSVARPTTTSPAASCQSVRRPG